MQNDYVFDRAAEDIGNIVEFGHVNVRVPDQHLATAFYVTGLGLTRDPYLVTGVENMWINAGTSQFHLPAGQAQVLRGVTVLSMPDLAGLVVRLDRVGKLLAGTRFAFHETQAGIEVMCPWGNRLRCIPSTSIRLGITSVELDTAQGTAEGIARFYREMFATPAVMEQGAAVVPAGLYTKLVWRETKAALPAYDGAHIQIGLADFSGPHSKLDARGLISEESNQHQYRVLDLVDLDTGAVLATLEHEVRSMRHPMFCRPLVNRDPAVTNNLYALGREPLVLGADLVAMAGSSFL
jgi:hypothetical protein